MKRGENSKLFFSKGVSSFLRTTFWKTDLSPLNGIDTLLDIFDHIYKFTFSVFFSIPLSICLPLCQYHNLFWVQWILNKSYDQIMWVLQLCSFSRFFCLFVVLQGMESRIVFFPISSNRYCLNFERDCIESVGYMVTCNM